MTNRIARTRIRSVREKATGREMRVISPAPRPSLNAQMLDDTRKIASYYPEGIAGYFVVAFRDDGTFSTAYQFPKNMGASLASAYVCDMVRRNISVAREVDNHLVRYGLIPDDD